MSTAFLRMSAGLVVWGGCLAGSLSIANWAGDLGHGICGPWGCGPPLQALIACHTAWLVALTLPVTFLIRSKRVSVEMLRAVGIIFMLLGASALAALFAHHVLVWWPHASALERPYFWKRYGLTVATIVDVPAVQVLLFGLAIWLIGRARRQSDTAFVINALATGERAHGTLPDDGIE